MALESIPFTPQILQGKLQNERGVITTNSLSWSPSQQCPRKLSHQNPCRELGSSLGFHLSSLLSVPLGLGPGTAHSHCPALQLSAPRVPVLPKPSTQASLSLGPWRNPRYVPCHIHSILPTPFKAALKSQSRVHPAGSRGCARILELLWAHSSTALLLVSTAIPEPSQTQTFLGRQCCCSPSFQSQAVLVPCLISP